MAASAARLMRKDKAVRAARREREVQAMRALIAEEAYVHGLSPRQASIAASEASHRADATMRWAEHDAALRRTTAPPPPPPPSHEYQPFALDVAAALAAPAPAGTATPKRLFAADEAHEVEPGTPRSPSKPATPRRAS